jgi:hypothetical protein
VGGKPRGIKPTGGIKIMNQLTISENKILDPIQAETAPQKSADRISKYFPTSLEKLGSLFFFFAASFAIYAGWKTRHLEYFTAENGWGYNLGIIGGSLMIIMLLYPVRKRVRFMQNMGPVKYWFRIHMMLGVLGPICVLFHANFQLGSTNSNVALFSMLVVAGSGLLGRYIYTRNHYGLYGSKINLAKLNQQLEDEISEGEKLFFFCPQVQKTLSKLSETALSHPRTLIHIASRIFLTSIHTRWVNWRLGRLLKLEIKNRALNENWEPTYHQHKLKLARQWINNYLLTVCRVVEFSFYDRLFSFWHVLHLPLFIMLLIAGIFHVIAVHAY